MTITPERKQAFFKTIEYVPHSKQWLYHNSTARFRLPNCGRRFGKSTMAGRDLEPRLFEPKKMFWIVGPTYDLGEKEFRVIWDDLIVKMALGKDKRVKKSYNKKQGSMYIEFPWQTRLEVRSADHPENLVGEALDHVIMSEAAKQKEDTWERFIRPALADRRGGADFPTTPEGFNWLYSLWMMGQNPDFPMYESWRFPSWDNDAIYPGGESEEEIILLKQTMADDRFLQEIAADFASFSGKIYPDWDDRVHVQKVEYDPNLPSYVCFDFGWNNPFAAIFFQVRRVAGAAQVRIWREYYKSYRTIPEHIANLKALDWPEGFQLKMGFGDAADPEAAATLTQKYVPTWAEPEAKENWRDGVDLVASFLKMIQIGEDENGAPVEIPGLVVDHNCTTFIHEINNYKAPESVKGRNVPEWSNKVEDHTMDAIRYGLMHVFKLGAIHSLAETMGGGVEAAGSPTGSGGGDSAFTLNGSSGLYEPVGSGAGLGVSSDGGIFTGGGVF
jgi:hypothetical protein